MNQDKKNEILEQIKILEELKRRAILNFLYEWAALLRDEIQQLREELGNK